MKYIIEPISLGHEDSKPRRFTKVKKLKLPVNLCVDKLAVGSHLENVPILIAVKLHGFAI